MDFTEQEFLILHKFRRLKNLARMKNIKTQMEIIIYPQGRIVDIVYPNRERIEFLN
jgi:hypothetical protein